MQCIRKYIASRGLSADLILNLELSVALKQHVRTLILTTLLYQPFFRRTRTEQMNPANLVPCCSPYYVYYLLDVNYWKPLEYASSLWYGYALNRLEICTKKVYQELSWC